MPERITSKVMAAYRPYGEFYDFYSVSPKYFGLTFVYDEMLLFSREKVRQRSSFVCWFLKMEFFRQIFYN
jgi:hypothetical protein